MSVPGYEIESVLGRGGMGVVYKARHLKLKRTVALKILRAGGRAGPRELARFRVEAEAVARLQHPNIVQIHEVGEADGRAYCALEFVEGVTLAAKLDGKPMTPTEAAKLVETLARAMQLAHSRNVVHRDLKPANILLAADGTPKITDFGLARQIDDDSCETMADAVMGTPSYMAPEQASGLAHEAGPAADVYSLGAILYDCLTGQPPFKESSLVAMLDQVRTKEPVAPSHRQKDVPQDLETICLKCLRKEPENRYASAAELADELGRFLRGEPILARPVSRVERVGKWVKRNPVIAGAAVAVVLALTVGTTVSYLKYRDAEEQKNIAEERQKAADEARNEAQREQKAERWARYRSNIAAASAALQVQNNSAARSALDDAPKQHRNWEWNYFHSQLDGARFVLPLPRGRVDSLVLSPSGRQVAAVSISLNECYLFDAITGKLDAALRGHTAPLTSVAYRPDGKQIATQDMDRTTRLWDSKTGQERALLRPEIARLKQQSHVARLAYNADGSRIATFMGTLLGPTTAGSSSLLWDTSTDKEIATLAPWRNDAGPVAFSPDGKRVAAISGEHVYLCDSLTGQRQAVVDHKAEQVRLLVYSPDGKRLASSTYSSVHLWDGETGAAIAVTPGNGSRITSMRFSPDGSRLVTGFAYPDSSFRFWDAANGRSLAEFTGHKNDVTAVAFSPDGRRLASTSTDQTARLWDVSKGQLLAVLRGHTGSLKHIVFSPNGTRVVTSAEDATLRLWDAQTGDMIGVLRGHNSGLPDDSPPTFTPDGSRLISGSADGTVRIWEISQVERNVLRGHTSFVYDVAFSPNGEQVASAAWDGTARLWDATTGRQTGLLKHDTGIITSVAYNRDGLRLATQERDVRVVIWDVASQKVSRSFALHADYSEAPRVVWHPDGSALAGATVGGPVRLLDAETGKEVGLFKGHTLRSLDVAFHPDGNLLASTAADHDVRLWDVTTRKPVAVMRGHNGIVWRVAFSDDGKLLASASGDMTIRLWDVQTRENLAIIPLGSIV